MDPHENWNRVLVTRVDLYIIRSVPGGESDTSKASSLSRRLVKNLLPVAQLTKCLNMNQCVAVSGVVCAGCRCSIVRRRIPEL